MQVDTLRLVLGDQLSTQISSLEDCDKERDIILLCEVWDEATYVKHHKKKIAFLFSAMRHFAASLRAQGYRVDYIKLDDAGNSGSFRGEVQRAIARHKPQRVVVTEAGEYRVAADMQSWAELFNRPVEIRDDTRFFCSIADFKNWAGDKNALRMEFFYREMRKRHNILMDGQGQPEGGAWNFDAENRKPPPSGGLFFPQAPDFTPDEITREVMALVAQRFPDHFGDLEPFNLAVTPEGAMQVLDGFIAEKLQHFGDYQDAMLTGQPFMYHSLISFYLNCGLLDPRVAVAKAEAAYRQGRAPLNAVEGFIRQIIGWREYVRGIYWLKMPDYAAENRLQAVRDLPWFYWTADTDMNCLRQCITDTKRHAYAHHIQRLMVLGNFALLAGIDPAQVNEWFMVVYADAYEWVELPNVTGMILHADGGFLGSKPYAAGGAYINRMSDYCKGCKYDVKEKQGDKACPFNYLYWDFMQRHEKQFRKNPRIGMIYKNLDRMDVKQRQRITDDAQRFLDKVCVKPDKE